MEFVDQLTSLSQSLWQEVSHDHLIKRYLNVLEDSLGVGPATYLGLSLSDDRIAFKSPEFTPQRRHTLQPQVIDSLEAHLNLIKASSQEYSEGVNTIVIDHRTLEFAMLGDPSGEPGLVVWEPPKRATTLAKERGLALDFITRQVQNSLRWLSRLDKTQALLYRDDLTGLYNYRYLDLALDSEIRRVGRFSTSFCLLFIDLDNFKPVNDHHGHQVGSNVLRQVADVLREALRDVDSIFRYGGDEYVVLLVEATSQVGLLAGERIRRQIEETEFRVGAGISINLTASIGVACCPDQGIDKESLIRTADSNMYRSKNSGKNRVSITSREGSDERKPFDPASLRKSN